MGLDARWRRGGRAEPGRPALRGLDLVRPAAARGARDQRRRHLAGARLRARGAGARRARALPARLDRLRLRPPRGRVPRAPARHRPVVPQHLRADQGRRRADRRDGARARARDRAAEHRHGRVRLRLDAGVQRPVLAAAGVLARAVQGAAGAADRARRHRAGRLRRRRARAPARPPRGRRVQPRRRAQRVDGRGAHHAGVGVLRQAAAAVRRPDRSRRGRRPRLRLRAVLRHAGRVRRRPRAVRARARGHRGAAAARLLRAAHGVRRGRALGQEADHARGRPEPARGARRRRSRVRPRKFFSAALVPNATSLGNPSGGTRHGSRMDQG